MTTLFSCLAYITSIFISQEKENRTSVHSHTDFNHVLKTFGEAENPSNSFFHRKYPLEQCIVPLTCQINVNKRSEN